MKVPAKQVKLLVGIPAGDSVKTDFALSLAMLVSDLCVPIPGVQHQFDVTFVKGSMISTQRQKIVNKAVGTGATHLLFLDSDMRFPSDTFRRLLAWDKPIVACNCTTRAIPPVPTARDDNGTRYGKMIYQEPDSNGLREVWRVGTGVMLIEVEVLKKMSVPHFGMPWKEEYQEYQGEDWTFCELAQKAGYSVFIDSGLSNEIGHIGQLTYEHRFVEKE